MKINSALSILLIMTFSINAQSAFRIKVVDFKTLNPVEEALVYISEIPLPDQETDSNGFVSFKSVPEDRKVKLNIRKKGYLPYQEEVVANRQLTIDNFVIVKLRSEPTASQVIFYGEVLDKEGKELEEAIVEVSILGKPFSTKTDKSGNYQIRIDGNILKSIPTFQIEAKKDGCKRQKISVDIPKSEIINKDIVLQCSSKDNLEKIEPTKAGNIFPIEGMAGELKTKVLGLSYSSNRLVVKLKIFNTMNYPCRIGLYSGNSGENSSKINKEGDIFYASSCRVADSVGNNDSTSEIISSHAWVNASLIFENIPHFNFTDILQIGYYYWNKNSGWVYAPTVYRNIPILKE